jgi:hypothetical protein
MLLTPDDSDDSSDEPNVTGLGLEVPSGTVEHVRVDDVDDETSNVVQVSGEDDSLGSKSSRSDLGNQGVTDGSDGKIVDTSEEDEQSTSSVVLAGSLGLDCSQNTGDQHERSENDLTPKVTVEEGERDELCRQG